MTRSRIQAVVALVLGAGIACTSFLDGDRRLTIGPTTEIVLGTSVQLFATDDGVPASSCVEWQAADVRVITITPEGRATGIALGRSVVQATCFGRVVTSELRVIEVPVVRISLSAPSDPVVTGRSVQLRAIPRDSTGSPLYGRSIDWMSSAPSVAWVSGDGRVHGVAPGPPVTITARSGAIVATASIQVVASTCATEELTLGQTGSGSLAGTDCADEATVPLTDRWNLRLAAPGTFAITVTSTAFDAAIVVLDSTGAPFAEADDDIGRDPELVVNLSAGRYTILATSFVNDARGSYTIRAVDEPSCIADRTLPLGVEQADALDDADCRQPASGRSQRWRLIVPVRSRVRIEMGSDAFDTFLSLFTASLSGILSNDDGGGGTNSLIETTLEAGTYIVFAGSYPGSRGRGTYRISATLSPP